MDEDVRPHRLQIPLVKVLLVVIPLATLPAFIGHSYYRIQARQVARHKTCVLDGGAAPGFLWLFGERGAARIYCDPGGARPTLDECRRLFPEAHIVHWLAPPAAEDPIGRRNRI